MSVKLEPCPFCNGEAEGDQCRGFINYKGQSANSVAVYCTNCEAEISMCYDDFPEYTPEHLMEMVVERWNKRDELATVHTQLKSVEAGMRDVIQNFEKASFGVGEALTTNAGKSLLLRLQEAVWLLSNCEKSTNYEWNQRRDAFLNPKPQDVM